MTDTTREPVRLINDTILRAHFKQTILYMGALEFYTLPRDVQEYRRALLGRMTMLADELSARVVYEIPRDEATAFFELTCELGDVFYRQPILSETLPSVQHVHRAFADALGIETRAPWLDATATTYRYTIYPERDEWLVLRRALFHTLEDEDLLDTLQLSRRDETTLRRIYDTTCATETLEAIDAIDVPDPMLTLGIDDFGLLKGVLLQLDQLYQAGDYPFLSDIRAFLDGCFDPDVRTVETVPEVRP